MGKLLKVLAFVFLVLSVAAILLGSWLFTKRELLKGRTQLLENAMIQLAAFIENQAAESQPATYPQKDVSECTTQVIETPDRSEFWKTYASQFEVQNLPTMDIKERKAELMTYYLLDPVTLKVVRDESGFKTTKGKGTMQDLLDEVRIKAEEQLKRLNQTRRELTAVREELVKTIEELNSRKMSLRQTLKAKADLEAKVAELEGTIREKDGQIATLTEEKRQLDEELAAEKQKNAQLQEDLAWEKAEVLRLRKKWEGEKTGATAIKVDPGEKGKVASVNQVWGFAVLELDEPFLKAILGEDMSGECPVVELLVKRPGVNGAFVAKVRLFQVRRDQKLGIADVLADWLQMPLQEGDIVYY